MVKLRLTRLGRKKVPFYRIAAMEALTARDGKAIAYVGTYNPLVEADKQVHAISSNKEANKLVKTGKFLIFPSISY